MLHLDLIKKVREHARQDLDKVQRGIHFLNSH
jgi:hypothetical protein